MNRLESTIYLADDHTLVANGIASLFLQVNPSFEVVIFPDGKALFDACLIKKPDLVFLDIEMPIWDGIKTLTELKAKFVNIPICILSMQNEKSIIESTQQLGAMAYLNKDCTTSELAECIDSVLNGERYYSREVLKVLSGLKKTNTTFQLDEPLSEREHEILVFLCDGLSPKEIADKIFLSPRTVETHKNNIMQKMGVNSVAKLISTALKNKIV
jgi:DNA-binding NarL/FixJ family response regulator